MSIIDATELAILDLYFGAQSVTPPGTLYIGLFTTMPDDAGSGGTEVSGGSYARASVTNNLTNFPSANPKVNANAISFTTATATWGTVLGYGVFSASSGGTALFTAPFLSGHKVVTAVDTSTETLTAASHGLVANDQVQFTIDTGGTLPGGLSASTNYYAISAGLTTDDFRVSATLGGSAVNVTSVGNGTIKVAKSYQQSIISGNTFTIPVSGLSVSLD